MKILYDPTNGKIYYAIKDSDWQYFSHSTNIPLDIGEIEETEESRHARIAILESVGQVNDQNEERFFVEIQADQAQVVEREDWIEAQEQY